VSPHEERDKLQTRWYALPSLVQHGTCLRPSTTQAFNAEMNSLKPIPLNPAPTTAYNALLNPPNRSAPYCHRAEEKELC
jgi:hypothetical protein